MLFNGVSVFRPGGWVSGAENAENHIGDDQEASHEPENVCPFIGSIIGGQSLFYKRYKYHCQGHAYKLFHVCLFLKEMFEPNETLPVTKGEYCLEIIGPALKKPPVVHPSRAVATVRRIKHNHLSAAGAKQRITKTAPAPKKAMELKSLSRFVSLMHRN